MLSHEIYMSDIVSALESLSDNGCPKIVVVSKNHVMPN